jgi:hypothetical protein
MVNLAHPIVDWRTLTGASFVEACPSRHRLSCSSIFNNHQLLLAKRNFRFVVSFAKNEPSPGGRLQRARLVFSPTTTKCFTSQV